MIGGAAGLAAQQKNARLNWPAENGKMRAGTCVGTGSFCANITHQTARIKGKFSFFLRIIKFRITRVWTMQKANCQRGENEKRKGNFPVKNDKIDLFHRKCAKNAGTEGQRKKAACRMGRPLFKCELTRTETRKAPARGCAWSGSPQTIRRRRRSDDAHENPPARPSRCTKADPWGRRGRL